MKMYRNLMLSATVVFVGAASLFAEPEIGVDSANFDMGIISEGSVPSIKHSFKIKNSGDKPLKITRVKPSCGCTAVGHDTLIAPGKEGVVTAEIKLTNFKPGKLRKYITVFSNSKKTPELSLSLACYIRSELNIEPSYVRMIVDNSNNVKETFQIITNKKDLVVSSVKFINDEKTAVPGAAWQDDLPIPFSHTLTKVDTKHPDGFVEYSLSISLTLPQNTNQTMYGKFIFATNHPAKSELTLTGSINVPHRM